MTATVWLIMAADMGNESPFDQHDLTLISAWESNYNHYKMWDAVMHPFPNFNDAAVDVWERISNFIARVTGRMIIYLYWD